MLPSVHSRCCRCSACTGPQRLSLGISPAPRDTNKRLTTAILAGLVALTLSLALTL